MPALKRLHENGDTPSRLSRAKVGAAVGLMAGALLALWVAVLMLANGSVSIPQRSGTSLRGDHAMAVYLGVAPLVGLVIGALPECFSTRLRAYATGALIGGLVGAVITKVSLGQPLFSRPSMLSVLVFMFVIGGYGGLVIRRATQDSRVGSTGRRATPSDAVPGARAGDRGRGHRRGESTREDHLQTHTGKTGVLRFSDGHVVRAHIIHVDVDDRREVIYDVIEVISAGRPEWASVASGIIAAAHLDEVIGFDADVDA